MFFVCEVAMGILKAINVSYPENALWTEAGIFSALCLVEVIRIFLGRRGNLASKSKYFKLDSTFETVCKIRRLKKINEWIQLLLTDFVVDLIFN